MISILLMALGVMLLAPAWGITDGEGLVTIEDTTNLNDAVRILELSSLKFESKKMLNQSNFNGSIGIPVHQVPWRQALEIIALKNNLAVLDLPGYIAFANLPPAGGGTEKTPGYFLDVDSQQVRINAIALLADRAYLKSLGIDWSTVLDGKVTINADFSGGTQVPGALFGLGLGSNFTVGQTKIEVSTLLNAIESNQKGTVIAKPNIVVASGKKGFIQVGQDISVKTLDEAGNTTDKFFATGVILNVEPTVVNIEGTQVVHMKLSIERSSGTPGNISTIINKSRSETELVLYDGEEAVIGGLYDTDTVKVRGGVPVLKDLPWWVLGIRYLTGYYKYETKERELVILLKTDIMENAVQRALKAAKNPPPSKVPVEAGDWGYLEH
jgi:type IV pilus assembly protein PilQ